MNTPLREVVADALPELPRMKVLGVNPMHEGPAGYVYGYTADQMIAFRDAALATLPTQSAGVEERARALLAAEWEESDPEWAAEIRDMEVSVGLFDEADRLAIRAIATAIQAASRRTIKGDEWYCEDHPWELMGHEGCKGAGMPDCARVDLLRHRLEQAGQRLREQEEIHAPIAAAALRTPAKTEESP